MHKRLCVCETASAISIIEEQRKIFVFNCVEKISFWKKFSSFHIFLARAFFFSFISESDP